MISMMIRGHTISSMHLWAISLLLIISAISSYTLGIIPYSLLIAIAAALATEIALVKFYLRAKLKLPLSAIITGLLIGMIAPQNAPALLVITASFVAVLSKFIVKVKHNPVFNPAALGLIIALVAFHTGDVWWASSSYNLSGTIISLAPLFAVAAYLSRRITAGLTFIIASIIIGIIMSGSLSLSASGLISAIFSANYLFGMIMVGDPKTSPISNRGQMAYGIIITALLFAAGYSGIPYPFLISLLAANLIFMLYRNRHFIFRHVPLHPSRAAQ